MLQCANYVVVYNFNKIHHSVVAVEVIPSVVQPFYQFHDNSMGKTFVVSSVLYFPVEISMLNSFQAIASLESQRGKPSIDRGRGLRQSLHAFFTLNGEQYTFSSSVCSRP